MTEIKSEGGQSYTIPLDSIDLTYLSKYVLTPHAEKRPLWTKERLDGESEYCRLQIVTQDANEDCFSEETFDTFKCHICNEEVPVLCFKKHNESEKHVTLKTIFQKVLERVSRQINISVNNNAKDIDKDVYYCVPCSKIIKIENTLKHESSEYHVKSQRSINVVHEFYKIFKVNKSFKEIENEEILDENRFGTEIIQNDTENNNVHLEHKYSKIVHDVTNEDKSNNDETKTVSSNSDYTMKPTSTVEHVVPNEKHNKALSSEENYFKDMVKKYNLKVNLPIVDGEFIHVASPSGVKVKISRDHFHSYRSIDEGIRVYCQMCDIQVELGEETKHKVSAKHARKVFLPVNEQFARTRNVYTSHCLICNTIVSRTSLTKHHLYNDNHVKLLNSAQLTDICQNNADLANVINTENNIERTHIEAHKIENHVDKSEENKIISGNDLGDHLNETGHIARTNNATSDQKLVFCKPCNVTVPQDLMEYHYSGTSHWSNALKNICTGVVDGLQAYLTKDKKTDSDSSEKQNDIPKNDNVTNQNDTFENDNDAKQNDTFENDNVANQNDTLKNDVPLKCTGNDVPKNDNVSKRDHVPKNDNVANLNDTLENDNVANLNDTLENDNVANLNDTLENDNVTNLNEILENDNVTNLNEVLENDVPKNDNVTNQNETPKNDDVTNQNDRFKNDNVANLNDILENDDVTNQNDTLKNDVPKKCTANDVPKNDNVTNLNDTHKNDVPMKGTEKEVPKNENVANLNDTLENDNVANQNDTVTNQRDILANFAQIFTDTVEVDDMWYFYYNT